MCQMKQTFPAECWSALKSRVCASCAHGTSPPTPLSDRSVSEVGTMSLYDFESSDDGHDSPTWLHDLSSELESSDDEYSPHAVRSLRLPQPGEIQKLRAEKVRIPTFWEIEVPQWTDAEFKEHFRVSRFIFEFIVLDLDNRLRQWQSKSGISPKKTVAIGLWYLKEPQLSFRALGLQFQIKEDSAYTCVTTFVGALIRTLTPRYVRLPETEDEMQVAADRFSKRSSGVFRQAIGAIDGVHVPIRWIEPMDKYLGPKKVHTLHNVAVVNSDKMFTYWSVSWPGSAMVQRIVQHANLSKAEFVSHDYYLLGDAGFTLEPWLLTPYKPKNKRLDGDKQDFNAKMLKTRSVVDVAVAELKGRWRILQHEIEACPRLVTQISEACVTLHNMCRQYNDLYSRRWEPPEGYDVSEEYLDDHAALPTSVTPSQAEQASTRSETELPSEAYITSLVTGPRGTKQEVLAWRDSLAQALVEVHQ